MAGLALSYAAVMGCFFVVQGIWVLKTGDISGVLARVGGRPRSGVKPKLVMRVGCAAVYIGGGAAVEEIVLVSLFNMRAVPTTLLRHINASWPHMLGPLFLVVMSSWGLAKPSGMLGWVKQTHPDLDVNDPFARGIMRVCAAVCLAIGVVMLVAFA